MTNLLKLETQLKQKLLDLKIYHKLKFDVHIDKLCRAARFKFS